jgi:general secretion pathway protein A
MLPLYGEHFRLKTRPFSVGSDPKFLYDSPGYKQALVELSCAVRERRGLMVVTGEVGTGKTILLRSLLQQIEDGHTRTAFVSTIIFNFRELLHSVCSGFGLGEGPDADDLLLFKNFVFTAYRNGDNVALVIDEAQYLPRDALEGVRQLSDLDSSGDKLLQIVLVGEPEIEGRLDEPGMRALKQRVALRWRLSPLSSTECREYIARHLEIAGGAAAIFPEPTAEAVYAFSGGIPRLIDTLCDNGLHAAYERREKRVKREIIEKIALSLHINAEPQRRLAAARRLGVNAAANGATNGAASEVRKNGAARRGHAPDADLAARAFTVPRQSFDRLIAALIDAMGPMAPLVVSERIDAMGELQESFPKRRFGELIEATSGEILSAPLKQRYRSFMAQEIRAIVGDEE